MADPNTKRIFLDAIKDAESWNEFINGNDASDVLTRLNVRYPTLNKALRLLFDNAGLPVNRFKTLDLLQLSDLPDDSYAFVSDDDVDGNNGIYIKEGSSWVKSKYDIQKIIEGVLDRDFRPNIHTSISGNIFDFVDSRGIRVASISNTGDVLLKGVDGSANDILNNAKDLSGAIVNTEFADIAAVVDKNGVYAARIAQDSQLYIQGVDGSIQSKLKSIESSIESMTYDGKSYNTQYYPRYTDKYKSYLLDSMANYRQVAPVPNFSGKQTMQVGTGWINDVVVDVDDVLTVPMQGYDPNFRDDIGVVHPNVWSFKETVLGYKYWMMITPYTNSNEDIEIPFLYGTNNPELTNWSLVSGAPQPFEVDPIKKNGSYRGYLSDSAMCYDVLTGDIVVYWRETLHYFKNETTDSGYDSVRARRFDGKKWSEAYYLLERYPNSVDRLLSYAIVFNEDEALYYLYYCSDNDKTINYMTSPHLYGGDWSDPEAASVEGVPGRIKCWHMDAKIIGDKVVILIHQDKNTIPSAEADALYLAISDDFKTFTASSDSIHGLTNTQYLYKGTFQPFINRDSSAYFIFLYTTNNWKLQVVKSNTVNLGV